MLTTYQTLDEPERVAVVVQEAVDLLPAPTPLPHWAHCYLVGAQTPAEQNPQRADRYLEQTLARATLAETLQTAARPHIAQTAPLIRRAAVY